MMAPVRYLCMKGIDLFVKILVFDKILSEVTRKEGIILDP